MAKQKGKKTGKPQSPPPRAKAPSRKKSTPKKPAPKKPVTLNAKQQAFVQEYLVDLNATQAAIRAGYSKKTAGAMGFQLLGRPHVQAAVLKAMETRAQRTEVTADKVVNELAAVAFSSIGDYVEFGPSGVTIRDKSELTDEQLRALLSVVDHTTQAGTRVIKVKQHDKIRALELLGRHLGIFLDRIDHNISTMPAIRIELSGEGGA